MIATQRVKSLRDKPKPYKDYITVNVLPWTGKYRELCPYFLRTDGLECNTNPGNILFENFYQGSKVYDVITRQEIYPSRFQHGKKEYLLWEYTPVSPGGDVVCQGGNYSRELYLRWRNSLWACQKPIRYPNGFNNKRRAQFSVVINPEGKEERLDYLNARYRLYFLEYVRLVRRLPIYQELLAL